MVENRRGAHTVYNIQYHFVWVTKYRYKVLRGEVAERARELIRQSCMAREIKILRGHVSAEHVHLLQGIKRGVLELADMLVSPSAPTPSLFVTLAAPRIPDRWEPYLSAFA